MSAVPTVNAAFEEARVGPIPPNVPSLTAALQHGLYRVDRRWGRGYRRLRRRLGLARPPRIAAYRGYAFGGRARVLGRALEDRGVPAPTEGAGLRRALLASWQRYATIELPEAEIEVRWGAQRWQTTLDEEGHLDLVVPLTASPPPGWHRVALSLRHHEADAEADVLVIDEAARFAVVTDIDDTVIDTNVRHPLDRAAALFLTDARTRLPFQGAAALYRALAGRRRPVFYLSSSPWNLYEHLDALFERHALPKGPMLLREWGISRHGLAPLGGHAHKAEKLEQLLSHVALPFVLIGDSGQEDAQHYSAVAERWPDRVLAIVIRDVGVFGRGVEDARARAERVGVPLFVTEDSGAAARALAGLGLLDEAQVSDVEEGSRAEAQAPSAFAEALGDD